MENPIALFQCPTCKGPHFNVTVDGKLVCASVTEKTDYKVKVGGCCWTGFIESKRDAEVVKAAFEAGYTQAWDDYPSCKGWSAESESEKYAALLHTKAGE